MTLKLFVMNYLILTGKQAGLKTEFRLTKKRLKTLNLVTFLRIRILKEQKLELNLLTKILKKGTKGLRIFSVNTRIFRCCSLRQSKSLMKL